MWTVFIFLILQALYCTVSSSPPSPINATFSSVNLRNLLQWFPGNGTPDDTLFTVQYAIYGDSVEGSRGRRVHWRAVRHCTEIVRHWCDLTSEMWDQEQGYHARVRAVGRRILSKWVTTRRFDPKSDTSFGPPLFSVEIEENSAIITLKGPMRYLPNNQTPEVSMATLYPHMSYNLSIHNTRRHQMNHFSVFSSLYKHRFMDYDTEYCFSAKTRFLSMPVQCQSSAWHCITTPQDPMIGQLQRVVVGIIVSSVCLCMVLVVGYVLFHYLTGKGQKSPFTLDPPSFHSPPLTFPPENTNLIIITVIKDELPAFFDGDLSKSSYFNKGQLRNVGPPPMYAPQRSETPPEPEELLDDLSVEYGGVGIAPKTTEGGEGEGGDWRHDGNNLRGECHKCVARDTYEKKQCKIEDDRPAGVYASQTKSPQINPKTQTQALLRPFHGASKEEVDREGEDREHSSLHANKNPQTGLFQIPFNLSTKWEGGMEGRTDRKKDEGAGEGSGSENVPLLCDCTCQNIKPTPSSYTHQSHFLSDDYGILRQASAQEEEEGTNCINWDPETRKLVLPEMAFNREEGWEKERGKEDLMGGEEEEKEVKEVKAMKGELRLENVFVRQTSGEEEEAQRRVETAWESNDIMTKWSLVLSDDQ
ncbi:interleukin-20 receptor subunit alpha [Scomber scombrus]|uniref:interleukin-20 receptor subunit alpha n=1 Tax=Scomber scombrus TaxID=13677 RepID=UPI002DDAA9A9|nr:interleukin-20 receptor subunit alpha [Scomber scombrus]